MKPVIQPGKFFGHIVRFRTGVSDGELLGATNRFANEHNFQVRHTFTHSLRGFATNGVMSEVAVERLRSHPLVASVEPDLEVTATAQYIPKSIIRLGGTASSNITTPGAASNPGPVDAHIFVLDTGVQLRHTDLPLTSSRSFVPRETSTDDPVGHGTRVAGVAAAANNSQLVLGIAPGARIHSFKVLDRTGSGALSNIIKALDAVIQFKLANPALQNRIVVNMSLGGYAGTPAYNALDTAIANAVTQHQITVVVAAGNDGIDSTLVTPAHCAEAITVGSYNDSNNAFSSFSNYGAPVDILAPGEGVMTTNLKNTTALVSGTSFSCPAIAGAAAVYLSRNPTATPAQVLAALKALAEAAQTAGTNPAITGAPAGTVTTSAWVRGL